MKKSEIKHITDTTPEPKHDPKLVFTGYILEESGDLTKNAESKPEHWDNVRHLVGNLFYAYDNADPDNGLVYIGKFV